MESTNQNKQAENEIGKHLQTLEIYIKEGGKEKGTVSGDMAITSLSIIENYITEYFFCKDFGVKPTLLSSLNMKGKKVIWGKKPDKDKESREGYELVLESDGLGGTKQRMYKKISNDEQVKPESQSQFLITETCNDIKEMLLDKNRKYGDSALNPQRIFSKADTIEQINVRIDDKLSRLKSGQGDEDEDVESDLLGYLILKKVAKKILQIKKYQEDINANH